MINSATLIILCDSKVGFSFGTAYQYWASTDITSFNKTGHEKCEQTEVMTQKLLPSDRNTSMGFAWTCDVD